uniref:Uncharacterized protein n=1 Tax=Anopheles atroparvus TaxID=41427 RepID=A0AAG5DN67_ANOAO
MVSPAGDITIATAAQFHYVLPFPSEFLTFLRQKTAYASSSLSFRASFGSVSTMPSMANFSTFLSNITLRALTVSAGGGGVGSGGTGFGTSSAEYHRKSVAALPAPSVLQYVLQQVRHGQLALDTDADRECDLDDSVRAGGLFGYTLDMRTCLSNWIAQSPCSIFPVPEP